MSRSVRWLDAFELDQLEHLLLERLTVLAERAADTRELRRRFRLPSIERDAVQAMLDSQLRALRADFAEAAVALQALSGGRYGRCEVCHSELSFLMLETKPWATRCEPCADPGAP